MKKLVALFALSVVSHAQTLTLDITATTVGHEFLSSARSTNDWIFGQHWGAAPAPVFSASLSDYDVFRLTLSAPAGYAFTIQSHPSSQAGMLAFGAPLSIWHAPGWDGGLRYSLPTTVSFSGFSGPSWYDVTAGVSVDTEGRAVVLEGAVWWSGSPQMHFNALTLEADMSMLKALGLPSLTFSPDIAVGFRYQNVLPIGTNTDPGAAVPEPTTSAIIVGAACALVVASVHWRRRISPQ
jgi:hypothetical protein